MIPPLPLRFPNRLPSPPGPLTLRAGRRWPSGPARPPARAPPSPRGSVVSRSPQGLLLHRPFHRAGTGPPAPPLQQAPDHDRQRERQHHARHGAIRSVLCGFRRVPHDDGSKDRESPVDDQNGRHEAVREHDLHAPPRQAGLAHPDHVPGGRRALAHRHQAAALAHRREVVGAVPDQTGPAVAPDVVLPARPAADAAAPTVAVENLAEETRPWIGEGRIGHSPSPYSAARSRATPCPASQSRVLWASHLPRKAPPGCTPCPSSARARAWSAGVEAPQIASASPSSRMSTSRVSSSVWSRYSPFGRATDSSCTCSSVSPAASYSARVCGRIASACGR